MEESKYHVLDEAICAHIRAGRGHPTNSSALEDVARPLLVNTFSLPWRLIDRRMQTMRRAGRLAYERKKGCGGHGRWVVVDA